MTLRLNLEAPSNGECGGFCQRITAKELPPKNYRQRITGGLWDTLALWAPPTPSRSSAVRTCSQCVALNDAPEGISRNGALPYIIAVRSTKEPRPLSKSVEDGVSGASSASPTGPSSSLSRRLCAALH
jgi:hypothetical protein